MDEAHKRVHLSVRGRVQSVGYRASLHREAARLGLDGWVRNRRDGSVEAFVQGDVRAVDRLLEWARRGPPSARVDDLAVSLHDEAHPSGPSAGQGFEIRPTV